MNRNSAESTIVKNTRLKLGLPPYLRIYSNHIWLLKKEVRRGPCSDYTNLGRSWSGAYIVQIGQYAEELIHDKNHVNEPTLQSPRVARRQKTPVGEIIRHQRSCTCDAASMNQEPNINHGMQCSRLNKFRTTALQPVFGNTGVLDTPVDHFGSYIPSRIRSQDRFC